MKLTKEDKAMLRAEYQKVWTKRDGSPDLKMIDYCTNKTSAYLDLGDALITFDKPSIETRFCFGEHGYDYDEVNETCDKLSRSESYFLAENIRRTEARDILDRIDGTEERYITCKTPILVYGAYCTQTSDCKLAHIEFVNAFHEDYWGHKPNGTWRDLTDEEIAALRTIMQDEITKFEKRLKTYLKRYGMSKCHFWTYWADR